MVTTRINAALLLASLNTSTEKIIYTWVLTYPRFILPEVNTHRMFSRNTSSSRAIPVATMRKNVLNDPFVPMYWGANQKGMQAGAPLHGLKKRAAKLVWKGARYPAVVASWAFEKIGLHKQIANRVLEPWMWCRQIVTATELDGFFAQRCDYMAEPHFRNLAIMMKAQFNGAKSMFKEMVESGKQWRYVNNVDGALGYLQVLQPGDWHLPFINRRIEEGYNVSLQKRISAARCARVSYFSFGTNRFSSINEDTALFDKLVANEPKHLSPLEHQARALHIPTRHGNVIGWKQFRQEFEECSAS